jgi:hypothetical protein
MEKRASLARGHFGQHQEMGARSLSFCRGNTPTYDSDRSDVPPMAQHQRNPRLAPSGFQYLTPGANRDGYSPDGLHQEMGVEWGGCGGRDLVDRAPGTHMFIPAHQNEMKGGKGRPDRSDQLGQPKPLRLSLVRASPVGRDDVRTSPTGSIDVRPRRQTSKNDQGVVNARSTSRNAPGGQDVTLPEQSYHAWSASTGVQDLRIQHAPHSAGCATPCERDRPTSEWI